jgi:DoxX-like protein
VIIRWRFSQSTVRVGATRRRLRTDNGQLVNKPPWSACSPRPSPPGGNEGSPAVGIKPFLEVDDLAEALFSSECQTFLRVKHRLVLTKSASWKPEASPARLFNGRANSARSYQSAGARISFERAGYKSMARKITYWVCTGLLAVMSLFAAYAYLSGSPEAVQGFLHVGYPQQLRIILGIAKPPGAITLLVPGLAKLKEWAYAGFTFAWISAFVAHYLAKDGPAAFMPLVLLLLLIVSYVTRPASHQWQMKVTQAA